MKNKTKIGGAENDQRGKEEHKPKNGMEKDINKRKRRRREREKRDG